MQGSPTIGLRRPCRTSWAGPDSGYWPDWTSQQVRAGTPAQPTPSSAFLTPESVLPTLPSLISSCLQPSHHFWKYPASQGEGGRTKPWYSLLASSGAKGKPAFPSTTASTGSGVPGHPGEPSMTVCGPQAWNKSEELDSRFLEVAQLQEPASSAPCSQDTLLSRKIGSPMK